MAPARFGFSKRRPRHFQHFGVPYGAGQVNESLSGAFWEIRKHWYYLVLLEKNAKGPVNRGVAVVLRAGGAFKRKVAHIGGFRITKNKAEVDKFGKKWCKWKILENPGQDVRGWPAHLPVSSCWPGWFVKFLTSLMID